MRERIAAQLAMMAARHLEEKERAAKKAEEIERDGSINQPAVP